MINASLKRVLSAALGLALVSAAAPMALADSPGYLFQDFVQQSAASTSKPALAPMTARDQADRVRGHGSVRTN